MRTEDVVVSTRERATLVLGFLGALLLVIDPLAYRITSEQADTTPMIQLPYHSDATAHRGANGATFR
jgi:hypothetical protein